MLAVHCSDLFGEVNILPRRLSGYQIHSVGVFTLLSTDIGEDMKISGIDPKIVSSKAVKYLPD